MGERSFETTAAFREFLDLIRDADGIFLEGDRAVADDVTALEGYRWLTTIFHVAVDCYVWGDTARPSFVELTGPIRRWGGDNSDAFYNFAPLDPERSYRVRGVRGDAVYLSLTVYGGPDDGHWSNRIVATLNDRHMDVADDGSFEVTIGPGEGFDMRLESDAVCVVTRDYLVEPSTQRKATWSIEPLDDTGPPRIDDAALARGFRAAANFCRDLLQICPIPLGEPNTIDEPYPVPEVTYGWAAGDASYAMGSFELADDEALVIEGRSPECAFWNLCLWNQYLQTFDYRHERVTINGGQVVYEPDGSWRIVIAHRDPGQSHWPNWLSTAGHERGRIWFRWFLADEVPARPSTKVVKVDEL